MTPDPDALFWDKRYASQETVWSLTPNVFVKEYCASLKPGRMVDIAGGEGRNALWLASRGWEAENLDFSAVAIEKSLHRAHEIGVADRFRGHIASILDEPEFLLAPVDLAVIAYLQIGAQDLSRAIHHTATQLRPGGLLVGVWHARENLTEGFGGPRDPDVLPTVDELTSALSAANLTWIEVALRERKIPEHGANAIDVIVRATAPDMIACG